MPFIKQWRREVIAKHGLAGLAEVKPGDRCYVHYEYMVRVFKADTSWGTVDALFRDVVLNFNCDELEREAELSARYLAWHVFFQLHVIPYERTKRYENGDI